jgi:YD repeat-containing protein
MDNTVKSVAKYITTYSRANMYNDDIVENKRQVSYLEMDENGNIIIDKTFDSEGNVENYIKRTYNEKNKLIEESFFDSFGDEPYEIRQYIYDDKNVLISSKVKYTEDEIEEQYLYSSEGNLLQKTVVYTDGYSYIEKEYEWENNRLVKVTENEEDDPISVQKMTYDEQGRLIQHEITEIQGKDNRTEKYEYDSDKLIKQLNFNYRGDCVSMTENKYEGNLLVEKTVESANQFLKYQYKYDEKGNKIQESILNHEDTVLTDYITAYNEDGLELHTKTSSLNIIDNDNELILIELNETEYSFFE